MIGERQDIRIEQPTADAVVVALEGEHDSASAPELADLLTGLVESHPLVVVDASELEFADSSVVDTLFRAHRTAGDHGHRLCLQFGTHAIVRRLFEITGVLTELNVATTREEALGH